MDELTVLSPTSRERSLDELPRKELQQLAKEAGVKVTVEVLLAYVLHTCARKAQKPGACRETSRART